MFMRRNRALSGAPQPETTEREDRPGQAASRKLSPNFALGERAEDWRFTPDMSSPEAINDAHYEAGVSDEPYTGEYEQHIPFVGSPDNLKAGRAKLAPEP